MKYTISYGSDSQFQDVITSTSRNAKLHGQKLLGTQSGGWIDVYTLNGTQVSAARYSMGGRWINAQF